MTDNRRILGLPALRHYRTERAFWGALRADEEGELEILSDALKAAHGDGRTSARAVRQQLRDFAAERKLGERPRLTGSLNAASGQKIARHVRQLTQSLFGHEPEIATRVEGHAGAFVQLVLRAQEEGNLPALEADEVWSLVHENLVGVGLQEHETAGRLLSDHGVRHVLHNLDVGRGLFGQLDAHRKRAGVPHSRAVDKLLVDQVTWLHDLGRATPVVTHAPDSGKATRDGHPLYAARFLRERFEFPEPSDPLPRVFASRDFARRLHQMLRTHDWAALRLDIRETSSFSRTRNLNSIQRLADGSHAFDSKLPALARHVPLLPALFALHVGQELGLGPYRLADIQAALKASVDAAAELPDPLRAQLRSAIERLNAESVGELVPRMFGPDPALALLPDGRTRVTLKQSPLAQILGTLFGFPADQKPHELLQELGGPEKDSPLVVSWDKLDLLPAGASLQRRWVRDLSSLGFSQYASAERALRRSQSAAETGSVQWSALHQERVMRLDDFIDRLGRPAVDNAGARPL